MYSHYSCDNPDFSTPFCTPGQFVFLVALITSVLTLIGIASQIRDRKNGLRNKIETAKSSPIDNLPRIEKLETHLNRAKTEIWVLNQIIGAQLILMLQALSRIVVTALFKIELSNIEVYDVFLVSEAFFIFGFIWPIFFIISTSEKSRYKKCLDDLTIKRQQKKPLPNDEYIQLRKTGEKLKDENQDIEDQDKDYGWLVTWIDIAIIHMACYFFSKDLSCKKGVISNK